MSTEQKNKSISKLKKLKSLLAGLALIFVFFSVVLSSNYSFSFLNIKTINFLETCIAPWDIGAVSTKYTVVRTIGNVCYERCKTACEGLPQQINYENLSEFNELIKEMNPDIISRCQQECRAGRSFSSPMRIPREGPNSKGLDFEWSDVLYADAQKFKSQDRSPSISTPCSANPSASDSASNNIYESGYRILPDTRFKMSLVGNPQKDSDNEIVMCGDEVTRIDPSFVGFTNNSWNDNSGLWATRTSSKAGMNARNYMFTDTEIDVIDGDELTLTYWGQYQFGPKFACSPNGCFSQFLKLRDPSKTFNYINTAANSGFLIPRSQFLFSNPVMDSNGYPTATSIQVGVDDAVFNRSIPTLGLTASTGKIPNSTFNYSIPKEQQYYDIGGYTIDKQNYYISFFGKLTGYSNNFTRLGIAHADSTDPNAWNDNVGGFSFLIKRKGCVYRQGEQLQWGLLRKQNSLKESEAMYETVPSEWHDVNVNDLKDSKDIDAPFSCVGLGTGVICEAKLVYRIKPIAFDPSKVDVCPFGDTYCESTRERVQKLFTPAFTNGQYNVYTVPPQTSPSGASMGSIVGQRDLAYESIFTTVVRKIRNHLFYGEASANPSVETGKGIVQIIFERLVSSGFADSIRALAVLYIAYTGLSFMIGTAQMTQKEAATRLIKLGIVLTLTAPDAWTFFYTNFFSLFIDGGLQLMVLIAGGLGQTENSAQLAAMTQDPTLFFTFFDYPVKILFAHSTMIKVAAIAMSSFMGLILAAIIIFAGVIYALCLFKAVVIYLISLIGIGILLMLSPIFISFMLFKYTSEMFKGWWTQLAILVAQPLFVIVGITIFNIILIMGLRVVLGFTACFGCLLGFNLPFMDPVCIIPGVFPLYNLHLSDDSIPGGGLPSTQFVAALFFLLLAQGIYYFVGFATSLANLIVGSAFAGIDLAQGADAFDPKQKFYNAFKFATGTDDKAEAAYQQYAGYKRAVRDTGVKLKNAALNAKDKYKEGKEGIDRLTTRLKNYARNTGEDNNG